MRKAKTARKRIKQTPEQKVAANIKRSHTKLIRDLFKAAGFQSVPTFSDKEFTYDNTTSDFDDIFIFDNVVVLCEQTTIQEKEVSGHIKKKKVLYDKIGLNPGAFIGFLRSRFPQVDSALGNTYQPHQWRVAVVYCSRYTVKQQTKDEVPGVRYLDYHIAKYFETVTKTVKLSSRFELFKFLGLEYKDVGSAVLQPKQHLASHYDGSILPEAHSHFDPGFKVVSFYIDPQALLERSYVLRKNGWQANDATYQRMIIRKKVESLRKYLRERKRAFVNNIIVTLPSQTRILNQNSETIKPETINQTQPAKIQIPLEYNSIGIVDGQHRIFSYHEGGSFEEEISRLRTQQNLLVTGVVFPADMPDEAKTIFEATLFLEINANQANASSELKQEISLVISPFEPESIAKKVINLLNDQNGALQDHFERFFFEAGKIKTTSIVSFGIRPLVNLRGTGSFFSVWDSPRKEELKNGSDHQLLVEYVKFCTSQINQFFGAVHAVLPSERWTADRAVEGHYLTTTIINGLLSCLRRIVRENSRFTVQEYKEALDELAEFNFGAFKSSQYNRMGEALYSTFFASKK